MNIQDAIEVIESVSGFTDESTPVGEAWLEILSYINRPVPPVAEEVEKLVKWLEKYSNSAWPRPDYEEQTIIYCQEREVFDRLTMAAHLLKQNNVVIPPAAVSPREFVLKEMTAEDGSSLGWYVNHSDFYFDIQKEDGVWGVYFRDKITEQEAYGEPNETND
jgi:hypothetical protein